MEPDNVEAIMYLVFIFKQLGEPLDSLYSLNLRRLKVFLH